MASCCISPFFDSDIPIFFSRNYGTLDGLQSFYPSDKSYGAPESPTFVPMEHLLNAKLENRAFDRLVASTQCSLRLDNFNQLRLVNKSSDSSSEHLRNHQVRGLPSK
jgi:hypothetical protein